MGWEDLPFYGSTCGYRILLVHISPQCVGVFIREYEMAKVENSPNGKDDTFAQTHVSVASRNSFSFQRASKQADLLKSHCMVLQLLGGCSILICYNTIPWAVGQSVNSITSDILPCIRLGSSAGVRSCCRCISTDCRISRSTPKCTCPRACLVAFLCLFDPFRSFCHFLPFDPFDPFAFCRLFFNFFSDMRLPCTLQAYAAGHRVADGIASREQPWREHCPFAIIYSTGEKSVNGYGLSTKKCKSRFATNGKVVTCAAETQTTLFPSSTRYYIKIRLIRCQDVTSITEYTFAKVPIKASMQALNIIFGMRDSTSWCDLFGLYCDFTARKHGMCSIV